MGKESGGAGLEGIDQGEAGDRLEIAAVAGDQGEIFIESFVEVVKNHVAIKKELHGTPPKARANRYGGCPQSSGRCQQQTCSPRHHVFQPAPA